MSTNTISDHQSESSDKNLSPGSSHSLRHESSVPRSTSDPTSSTKTSSQPHSPNKSWHQSYSSFQNSTQAQCPCMHYHPWCDDCLTLTEWEQPPPIRQTRKPSRPTFGDLKTAVRERSRYRSPSKTPSASQAAIRKVCSQWRDEQFAKAITKRCAKMAAQEALRWQAHQRRAARGAAPQAT